MRSNHVICLACAQDREPTPFAQSDEYSSVILKDDNASVINGQRRDSEVDASKSRSHGRVEDERPNESSPGSTVSDVDIAKIERE